jgi:anti-sigma regulatory factor (Ser/Thr protein kinase)
VTGGRAGGVHVQLRLTSRPENVGVVRAMLSGVIDALDLSVEAADGIRTAVSEACNNVVLHAYPGAEGPMEVDLSVRGQDIEVVVRDRGTGIRPHAELGDDAMHGVGLAVVQAFTDRVELRGAVGEGTEVLMEFAVPGRAESPDGALDAHAAPLDEAHIDGLGPGAALLSLAPTPLGRPVLARVAAALATRARFTVDRLSDAQLVTDAIAAHAAAMTADGRLLVRFEAVPRALQLTVGPLLTDTGAQLVREPVGAGLEAVIERLSDEVRVEAGPDGDLLIVRMTDDRRPVEGS